MKDPADISERTGERSLLYAIVCNDGFSSAAEKEDAG